MIASRPSRLSLMALAGCLLLVCTSALWAQSHGAAGPVVLTVTGKIEKANRPAFDELQDVFFNYHQRKFTKAYEFDREMLEALGMTKGLLVYTAWPKPVSVEGPLLRDVLSQTGLQGSLVRITALDGFAVELSPDDLQKQDWIVALKADGRYLNIGQRGPIWVVYARRDGKPATAEDEHRWPWAAFLIEVE
jgi:hypothetical protein